MISSLISLDTHIFLFLNRDIANPFFDFFFVTITNAKFWILPALIAAGFFIKSQKKKALIVLVLAIIAIAISDQLSLHLKHMVGRARPCNPHVFVQGGRFLLGMKPWHDSFPSSHSANIFAQAMLFTWFYRKRYFWFFTFAFIIGFSRIYVGVHFPSDVFAGAILGCIVGLVVYFGYVKITNNKKILTWRENSKSKSGKKRCPESVEG